MPTVTGKRRNHRVQSLKLANYKQRLIAKGVVDGTNKMNTLLCKFTLKYFY